MRNNIIMLLKKNLNLLDNLKGDHEIITVGKLF